MLSDLRFPSRPVPRSVRSRCDHTNFHVDYGREVGVRALTLMTPLDDFSETASFQLLYKAGRAAATATQTVCTDGMAAVGEVCSGSGSGGGSSGGGGSGGSSNGGGGSGGGSSGSSGGGGGSSGDAAVRRYQYRKGKALCFGASFVHSTEPGRAADGELHAYARHGASTGRLDSTKTDSTQTDSATDSTRRAACLPPGALRRPCCACCPLQVPLLHVWHRPSRALAGDRSDDWLPEPDGRSARRVDDLQPELLYRGRPHAAALAAALAATIAAATATATATALAANIAAVVVARLLPTAAVSWSATARRPARRDHLRRAGRVCE